MGNKGKTMGNRARLRIVSLVLLLLPSLAGADAFDRARRALPVRIGQADLSGFSIRGGAALQSGAAATSATLLRGQASIGKSCGAFDLATSLTDAFETIPDMLWDLVQQLISSMPMLVFCYSSPSLCNLTTHFQNLISALVQAKFSQCTQVQTTMAYSGLRLRGDAISKCLETQADAGVPIRAAMTTCMSQVETLRLPNGLNGTQMSVIQDTLDAAGASQEMKTLARGLLGDITMQAGGARLAVQQERPQGAMMQRFEAHRVHLTTALQGAIDEVRTTGTVAPATLEAISVPGQPLPRAALDALVAMRADPVRYDSFVQKLATNLSLAKLTWECGELSQQLEDSVESNEHLSDEARAKVQRQIASLHRELDQVRAKKRVIEHDLQPAVDALMQEYARMQDLATQTGLRTPRAATPTMPYGTQGPLGYSQ